MKDATNEQHQHAWNKEAESHTVGGGGPHGDHQEKPQHHQRYEENANPLVVKRCRCVLVTDQSGSLWIITHRRKSTWVRGTKALIPKHTRPGIRLDFVG